MDATKQTDALFDERRSIITDEELRNLLIASDQFPEQIRVQRGALSSIEQAMAELAGRLKVVRNQISEEQTSAEYMASLETEPGTEKKKYSNDTARKAAANTSLKNNDTYQALLINEASLQSEYDGLVVDIAGAKANLEEARTRMQIHLEKINLVAAVCIEFDGRRAAARRLNRVNAELQRIEQMSRG